MTVRTTVKIDGDSTDAVRAVNNVSQAIRAASAPALRFAGDTLRMTAAVLGAESAVAGLRIALHSIVSAAREYAASNEEAAAAFGALAERSQEARLRIGEMVVGGDNARIMAGALSATLDDLTGALGGTAGAQAIVRAGLADLLDVASVGVEVVGALRRGFDLFRAALVIAARVQEAFASGAITLGSALMDWLLAPVEAVTQSLRVLFTGLDRAGQFLGGRAAEATRGLADAMGAADDSVDQLRQRLGALAGANLRGVTGAFDGLGDELLAMDAASQATYRSTRELAAGLADTAAGVRDGSIAIEGQTAALRGQAAAAKEASAALAALSAEQIKAKLIQPGELGDAKGAQALQAQKAADLAALAALDAQRAAAAEDAARRISEALALEQASMQRRMDVARETGDAVARALAAGVSGQRDASRQIVAIIADELRKRIVAAIATSTLLAATPGGQALAGFLAAAVGTAAAALTQIGGRGGGGASGGSAAAPPVNVTVNYTGQQAPSNEFVAAVVDAVQRGTRRGMVGT